MTPSLRSLTCALALLVPHFVRAQALTTALPTAGAAIPAQTLSAGGTATIDLKNYFSVPGVNGQVAQFNTVSGSLNVELLAGDAPNHAANFVTYANSGAYTNSLIHRVAAFTTTKPAIVQGGGYKAALPATTIPKNAAVALEYKLPNARGTLAAARTTDVNSATSEWFFNTEDNSTTLNQTNGGGYTVFGRVLGSGMSVVDALAAFPRFNQGGAFTEIPLQNYTSGGLTVANLVVVNTVRIVPIHPTAGTTGSVIAYSATSSLPGVATATFDNSSLVVTGMSSGTTAITVTATDANNNKATSTFNVTVAAIPPSIAVQPSPQTATAGSNVVFAVSAGGSPGTYQWLKNGAPIAGANSARLALNNIGGTDAGAYSVTVTNSAGTVTSSAAALAVAGSSASKLRALSVRSSLAANQRLIVGFSVSGGAKPLFVQASGPGLAAVGVTNALPDPKLEVYGNDGAKTGENDDWLDAVATTRAAVGAFPVGSSRKDAALVTTLSGNATAHVFGSGSGLVLVEGYDAGAGDAQRLYAVSARNQVGTGDNILIVGLVVDGTTNRNVIILGAGPLLTKLGVTGALADPKIEIYDKNQVKIAENDNWPPALEAAIKSTGTTFDAGSKDAALVLSLPPGNYTVQISGVGSTTGEALASVFEVADPATTAAAAISPPGL